jgi:hypothetical protein
MNHFLKPVEVCNKLAEYTVLKTKALEASKEFGENYYLFGPSLQNQL